MRIKEVDTLRIADKTNMVPAFELPIAVHLGDQLRVTPVVEKHQRLITKWFGKLYLSGDAMRPKAHMLSTNAEMDVLAHGAAGNSVIWQWDVEVVRQETHPCHR